MSLIYRQDEPAAEPTRLGDWLPTIKAALRRHLIMSEEAVTAAAFWVVHTYVYREREAVAYVAIQSPEKRCGKTTLLSVLAGMACNPVVASNITVGALFRAIDEAGPTLLIDEADTFMGANSAMRGILNAGNTRQTAFVLRLASRRGRKEAPALEGRGVSEVVKFSCWCPKVIAMIGKAPETLADRCIVVNMTRKLTTEKCAPLSEFDPVPIRRALARWAQDNAEKVRQWPRQPTEILGDRASDTFEPLMVLAAMAGEGMEDELREAAVKLCGYENVQPEAASLLLDIMSVFLMRQTQKLFSRDLAAILKGKSGWVAYDVTSRKAVTELSIAVTLRKYGIKPTTIRIGSTVSKGYKWGDFRSALDHYVPKIDVEAKIAELKEMNDVALEAEALQEKERAIEEAKAADEAKAELEAEQHE
jgi:hypothetical protein